MQPIAKNNPQCVFKACQLEQRPNNNTQQTTNQIPITEVFCKNCNDPSSHVQGTILQMDQMYSSSFFFWVKNPQNAAYIGKRLKPFFFQYSNEELLRAICWIWSDWEPSMRHKFLHKFIPTDLAEECCGPEEEEKIVQFLFLLNECLPVQLLEST